MRAFKQEDLIVRTAHPTVRDTGGEIIEDTSIRGISIKHIPTGISTCSFLFREQHLNKAKAMTELAIKLERYDRNKRKTNVSK